MATAFPRRRRSAGAGVSQTGENGRMPGTCDKSPGADSFFTAGLPGEIKAKLESILAPMQARCNSPKNDRRATTCCGSGQQIATDLAGGAMKPSGYAGEAICAGKCEPEMGPDKPRNSL